MHELIQSMPRMQRQVCQLRIQKCQDGGWCFSVCVCVCCRSDWVSSYKVLLSNDSHSWVTLKNGSRDLVRHQTCPSQTINSFTHSCNPVFLLASVDFHWESREGDSRPQYLPETHGGSLHPHKPSILVPQRRHLHACGDPGLPDARWWTHTHTHTCSAFSLRGLWKTMIKS